MRIQPQPDAEPLSRTELINGLGELLAELTEPEFRVVLYQALEYVHVVVHGNAPGIEAGVALDRIPPSWRRIHEPPAETQ